MESNDEATIAENVYNASFSKTGWNVTIPRETSWADRLNLILMEIYRLRGEATLF